MAWRILVFIFDAVRLVSRVSGLKICISSEIFVRSYWRRNTEINLLKVASKIFFENIPFRIGSKIYIFYFRAHYLAEKSFKICLDF